jgi:hypothetical protein
MTLVDPSANPARTIAASAEAWWLLLDSIRYAQRHRPSVWLRLRPFDHRLKLQRSIRSLYASLPSEHSRALVCSADLQQRSGWAEAEIEALRKSSPVDNRYISTRFFLQRRKAFVNTPSLRQS